MQGRKKCISARAHNGGKGRVGETITRDKKNRFFCVSLSRSLKKPHNIPRPPIAKLEDVCMHNLTTWAWGGTRVDSKTLFSFSNDQVFLKLASLKLSQMLIHDNESS